MKHLLLTAACLACTPTLATSAQAGGPVIATEDGNDAVVTAPDRDRRIGAGWIIGGGLLLIALIASGGSDTCTTEDPVDPEPGRC